jgi:hypothetical protein
MKLYTHAPSKHTLGLLAIGCLGLSSAQAQVLLVSPTFSLNDAADSTVNVTREGSPPTPATLSFANRTLSVSTFVAGGELYQLGNNATDVFVRRNLGIPSPTQNGGLFWYAREPGVTSDTGPFSGTYADNYAEFLTGNNLYQGIDNTFANGNFNNVERLDFYFSGFNTTGSELFTFFERSAGNAHDPIAIGLITGWDSNTNTPTSYSDLARTPSNSGNNWNNANYTAAEGLGPFNYTAAGYDVLDANENVADNITLGNQGSQGVSGIGFRLADFNLTPGTTIYGYSLFPVDIFAASTGTALASGVNLTDWTTFPTNTPAGNGSAGGADLVALNGVFFTAVPEPSTFGLAAFGVLALSQAFRRQPRTRRLSKVGSA